MLFRSGTRKDGLRVLHRKVTRTGRGPAGGVDLHRRLLPRLRRPPLHGARPTSSSPAAGGPRPSTGATGSSTCCPTARPSSRAIVEGANSYITPEARVQLQKKGVLLLRDASANKCGVISSSYEIIANLLLTEEEFLKHKKRYVKDVLAILVRRAADEANLIMARRREQGLLGTEISDRISGEINAHYARLFKFFQAKPELSAGAALPRRHPLPPPGPAARGPALPEAGRPAAAQVPLRHPGRRDRLVDGLPGQPRRRIRGYAPASHGAELLHQAGTPPARRLTFLVAPSPPARAGAGDFA